MGYLNPGGGGVQEGTWEWRLGIPIPPGKNLRPESWERTGNLTEVLPNPVVDRLKTLHCPILWMRVIIEFFKYMSFVRVALPR